MIGIFMSQCKEKALFIFRELDLLGLTGGAKKKHVGGIITLYYFTFLAIILGAFSIHYLFFNS